MVYFGGGGIDVVKWNKQFICWLIDVSIVEIVKSDDTHLNSYSISSKNIFNTEWQK